MSKVVTSLVVQDGLIITGTDGAVDASHMVPNITTQLNVPVLSANNTFTASNNFTITPTASANVSTVTVTCNPNPSADASSDTYTCITCNSVPQSNFHVQLVYGINVSIFGFNQAKVDSTYGGSFSSGISATNVSAGTLQGDNIWGVYASGAFNGSGTVTNIYGLEAVAVAGGGTGSIVTNLYSVYAYLALQGSTAVTNAYGFYLAAPVGVPANATNRYGLYVGSQGAGGQGAYITDQGSGSTALHIVAQTSHAIAVDGGDCVFKAGTAGVVPVTIQAAASQTADLLDWKDSNNNVLCKIDSAGRFYLGTNPPTGLGESISSAGNIVTKGYVLLNNGYNLNMGVEGPRRMGCQGAPYIEFGSSDASGVPAAILDTNTGNPFSTQKLLSGRNAGTEKYSITSAGEIAGAGFISTIVNKTAAYTLTTSDSMVTADATTAAFAVTLPAANGVAAGREYIAKKVDSSANAVTLTAAGTDKIDGAATYALSAQYKYVKVKSDGASKWWVIANN